MGYLQHLWVIIGKWKDGGWWAKLKNPLPWLDDYLCFSFPFFATQSKPLLINSSTAQLDDSKGNNRTALNMPVQWRLQYLIQPHLSSRYSHNKDPKLFPGVCRGTREWAARTRLQFYENICIISGIMWDIIGARKFPAVILIIPNSNMWLCFK